MANVHGMPVLKMPLNLSAFLGLAFFSSFWPAMPLVDAQGGHTEAPRQAGLVQAKDSEEILENKAVKILSVKVISKNLICAPDKQVEIIYRAEMDFSPQTIIIDMFDAQGDQIPGTRAETEGLYAGEVKPTFFCIPPEAASYKVRLPKPEE